MSKIFLNVGGNVPGMAGGLDGLMRKHFGVDLWHTFEPNPVFASYYKDYENHVFHDVAAWTKNGEGTLWLEGANLMGSSLVQRNEDQVPLPIKTIDFAQWLKDNVTSEDTVICRVDIEGGEYELLEHLIAEGRTYLIDELSVEFHARKFPKFAERENKLKEELANYIDFEVQEK